jgi:7-cyano-7-deazaguanine synthase
MLCLADRTCPDNSEPFLDAFQKVIDLGTMTDEKINIVAPLIKLDKKGVIKLGYDLGAKFELSWSCHNNNGNIACGGCSNCAARRQGFIDLGKIDPIEYA